MHPFIAIGNQNQALASCKKITLASKWEINNSKESFALFWPQASKLCLTLIAGRTWERLFNFTMLPFPYVLISFLIV